MSWHFVDWAVCQAIVKTGDLIGGVCLVSEPYKSKKEAEKELDKFLLENKREKYLTDQWVTRK